MFAGSFFGRALARTCVVLGCASAVLAESSVPFHPTGAERPAVYRGSGHTGSPIAPDSDGWIHLAGGPFSASNVTLQSWLSLADFGPFIDSGNDCWGYVSPTGREYALMSVSNQLAVVEITDPINPVIVGSIPHTDCLWGDVKVYQDKAYVVTDVCPSTGIQVIELANVDAGSVSLIQTISSNGEADVHNLAIDTDNGFMYLCLGNINGGRVVAYDLTNPANPVIAGMMTAANGGDGLHDAQAYTFTSGPNAGKQIIFGGSESRGLDIYDVTDKANMFRLSRTTYPGLQYAHQVWISDDQQYLYLDDELDGINRTSVFDISNLSAPVYLGDYDSGVASIDHNLYYHSGFIYEAEYTAGMRIFCADDPVNPVQVGWFDSHPESDDPVFSGAWSVYPYFPSGNVLISDENRGLFVVNPSAALDVPPCGGPPPGGVPTVSEWGTMVMGLSLMTGGTIVFGRRRVFSL